MWLFYTLYRIEKPHEYSCPCTECSNHKEIDQVVFSRSRLNAFRGLASTAYMSLSTDEPFLNAFKLSNQLRKLKEREEHYKVNSICSAVQIQKAVFAYLTIKQILPFDYQSSILVRVISLSRLYLGVVMLRYQTQLGYISLQRQR